MGGNAITRYEVCALACRAYTSTLTASNIQAAFRKSGVFPLNPNVISPLDLATSTAFKTNNSTQAFPEKSDESFFQTKGGQILKNVQQKKPRNTLSKVVGGRAITESPVVGAIKLHLKSQSKQCADVEQCIISSAVPSTSGLRVKRKQPPVEEVVSSDSDDSDLEESDKCIICKLFYPPCSDTKLSFINIVSGMSTFDIVYANQSTKAG
ncbi:hypothetical protein DPMN_191867 [Dreissena polymorpha]|uniref:Uncharacterized protein n=1 Tax=Dreissena polymorpha TaxID=45954 RepID=A0A9D3XZR7_DREPO|nr:hypothetical protein DPMN_191867 [Dreissena polymorpha]